MITIFPCGSRRSKGVPSGRGVYLRILIGELGTPKLVQIFAYGKWLSIPIQNATTQRVRSGPKMSESAQFWGRVYFPTKYLCPYHPRKKITTKPYFGQRRIQEFALWGPSPLPAPSPSPPLPFSSLLFPSPPILSPSLPSLPLPLEVGPLFFAARGSGEHSCSPQWVRAEPGHQTVFSEL